TPGEGIEDRAAQARRREETVVAQLGEPRSAGCQVTGCGRVEIALPELLRNERRRRERDRLGRRTALAGEVALRRGPLPDREERLARPAVEHEYEPVLGRLRHGVDRPAVAFECHEHG